MFLEQAQHTRYVLYLCVSRNQDHAILHFWLINFPLKSRSLRLRPKGRSLLELIAGRDAGRKKRKGCGGRLWQREEGGKRRRSGRGYGIFVGGSEKKKAHKKRGLTPEMIFLAFFFSYSGS